MATARARDERRPVQMDPEVHRRLRIFAAEKDVTIQEAADIAIRGYLDAETSAKPDRIGQSRN